ncbi:MAG: glycerophosphodiester phosphodiesterase [Gemmatimonadaceae bacterium]
MNILLDAAAKPVIGHRGNRAYAPENTMESFRQAVALGADAIEFDVRLSADGIPVVHHDPTVTRTTDGTGEIARMNYVALKDLDAGASFTRDSGKTYPYRGAGHHIPKFEDVIEAFPSTPFLIEIKDSLAATGIREIIERHKAEWRCLIDSMDGLAVRHFENSSIAVGAARGEVASLMKQVLLRRRVPPMKYKALCVPLSYNGLPLPVRRFAKVAAEHDCRVHVWTVNDPATAVSLWNDGINGIISDDPALMLSVRARLGDVSARLAP